MSAFTQDAFLWLLAYTNAGVWRVHSETVFGQRSERAICFSMPGLGLFRRCNLQIESTNPSNSE